MSTSKCIDTISVSPDQFPLTWRGWLRAGAVLVARLTAAPFDLLWTWQSRIQARRELRALDDRILKDIGVSRDALNRMAYKPFWLP